MIAARVVIGIVPTMFEVFYRDYAKVCADLVNCAVITRR
jgi:hypothetical protein